MDQHHNPFGDSDLHSGEHHDDHVVSGIKMIHYTKYYGMVDSSVHPMNPIIG